MNEFTYAGTQAGTSDDVNRLLATQPAVTDELAQKILMGMQHDIEAQIDWRLQQRGASRKRLDSQETGLILGSIGIGVPLTAIAGALTGLAGIVVVWIALTLINVAWAARR